MKMTTMKIQWAGRTIYVEDSATQRKIKEAIFSSFSEDEKAKTTRKPWTDEDLKYLDSAIKNGTSMEVLSAELGRTKGAIWNKVYIAGRIKEYTKNRREADRNIS